jgi:ribosomal protein S18 acetylase RimI-like enzyme
MIGTQWIQFTWDTTKLPANPISLDERYQLGQAVAADEALLLTAIERSYTTEQAWGADLRERLDFINHVIAGSLATGEVTFLILRHGARIIAASGVAETHSSQRHLVTGICVMNEYRSRGLGTYLLHESLRQLKERGVTQAKALTKRGVTAEKFLYPKFGAERQALAKALAA